ncbi:MAG: hypothetical protein Fur0018_02270 [Anaerolineales bacterium]
MLTVISDLHLTDGSTGVTIATDAFGIFAERLRDMAYAASWRSDDRYRPVDEIHLLLLGDVFDHLLSTRWAQQSPRPIRPWDAPQDPAFSAQIEKITRGILTRNAKAFEILKRMSSGEQITLPPATANGRPAFNTARQPVPVRIHYMVGNHDWYLHLPGAAWDNLRSEVIQALGLSNERTPFPHTAESNPALLEICRAHSLYPRHGDIYDGFNYDHEKGRNAATLGDAIVVELINRFPVEVANRFGNDLPPKFTRGLREIANVRPNILVPVWIEALVSATCQPAQQAAIKAVWDELAAEFIENPFIRQHDTSLPFDRVDFIQGVLFISRLTSLRRFGAIAEAFYQKFWHGEASFARHALNENAIREGWANYVVYGHTHQPEITPLNVFHLSEQHALPQVYFNSGTWHAIHEMTLSESAYARFISRHTMTFLTFFQGDERKGRPFETWSGSLGWQGL